MAPKESESCKIRNFIDMFWDLRSRGGQRESSWTSGVNRLISGLFMGKGRGGRARSAGGCFRSMTMRLSASNDIWTRVSLRRFFMRGFPGLSAQRME
jgi:hypothetical protein